MLSKKADKSNHMSLSLGSYLENSEPKVLEDLEEPHSKFEVELGQGNIAIRGSVQSLQLVGCNHLEVILLVIRAQYSEVSEAWRSS